MTKEELAAELANIFQSQENAYTRADSGEDDPLSEFLVDGDLNLYEVAEQILAILEV